MYIGNINTKNKVIQWLNEYYHSNNTKLPCIILHGSHGNGKTYLVELLAKQFKVDIYKITADDVATQQNIKDCIQRLNLRKLDGSTEKIILLDSIEEFKSTSCINKIVQCAHHPVICTTSKYYQPTNFAFKFKNIPVYKPYPNKLYDLLEQQNTNLTNEQLHHIAQHSPSIRSALNSLHTGEPNTLIDPNNNILGLMRQLPKRAIKQDMNLTDILIISKKINCFTEEGQQIYSRFCIFNADIKIKFKGAIDSFVINNMLEPIEKVQWFTNNKISTKQVKQKEQPKKDNILDYF